MSEDDQSYSQMMVDSVGDNIRGLLAEKYFPATLPKPSTYWVTHSDFGIQNSNAGSI